jgi:G3E family GTPase
LLGEGLEGAVVIINEFGEIGLDHHFIDGGGEELIELANGCLCCTVRGELSAILEDILARRDHGLLPRGLARVIIETTGLADPGPVLSAVLAHPHLAMRYAVAGVVTVVDAVAGAATLDAHEEAVRQVGRCRPPGADEDRSG